MKQPQLFWDTSWKINPFEPQNGGRWKIFFMFNYPPIFCPLPSTSTYISPKRMDELAGSLQFLAVGRICSTSLFGRSLYSASKIFKNSVFTKNL